MPGRSAAPAEASFMTRNDERTRRSPPTGGRRTPRAPRRPCKDSVVSVDDIAIVAGGASGVGKATAELLASHGISVVAIDRAWPSDQPGSDAVERLTGDVVDDSTWSTALEVAERLGAPSMLVLNAAKLVVGTVLEVTAEEFRAVMEVNVIAAVKGLQATLPSMLSRGRGSIVGVASTNSLYAEQTLA